MRCEPCGIVTGAHGHRKFHVRGQRQRGLKLNAREHLINSETTPAKLARAVRAWVRDCLRAMRVLTAANRRCSLTAP